MTWVFPGEINNPHSLAHSSIASSMICTILISSSTFVHSFQTAFSSANCERSTLYLISRVSSFCLRESAITLIASGSGRRPAVTHFPVPGIQHIYPLFLP